MRWLTAQDCVHTTIEELCWHGSTLQSQSLVTVHVGLYLQSTISSAPARPAAVALQLETRKLRLFL